MVGESMTKVTKIEMKQEFNYYNEWSVEIETQAGLSTEETATIHSAIESIRAIMQPKFEKLQQEALEEATKLKGQNDSQ